MSVDLYASLRKPVNVYALHESAVHTARQLLRLSELDDLPALHFVDGTLFQMGRALKPGSPLTAGHMQAMQYGPGLEGKKFALGGRAGLNKTLEVCGEEGQSYATLMPSPNDQHWLLVITPHDGAVGKLWSIALGLAAAELGDGTFYSHELWPTQDYPEDPKACLDALVEKSADWRLVAGIDFRVACSQLVATLVGDTGTK